MRQSPTSAEASVPPAEVTLVAERLLSRIRRELLELDPAFGVDADLFNAGLDSMVIMQIILIVEEEFNVKLPDCAITRETFATVRHIAQAVSTQGVVR